MITTPPAIVSEHHSGDHGAFYFAGGRRDPDPMAYDGSPRTFTVDAKGGPWTVFAGDSMSGKLNTGKRRAPLPYPR